jgi:hypothetical protein
VSAQHIAVLNNNVLTDFAYAKTVFADSGFKTQAVIVYIEIAIEDINAVAGVNIQTIAVDAGVGILKSYIFNRHVFAVQYVCVPEGGVAGCKIFEQNVPAVVELY